MPPDSEHGPGARDDERGLERELKDLGARLDYPPTPDLARAARLRLEEEGERTPRRGEFLSSLPSPWWAAAAVVLVLALPVLSSDVRSALSEFFTMGSAASGGAVSGGGGGGAQGGGAGGAAGDGGRDVTMESGQKAAGGAAGEEETMASSVASGAQSTGGMAAGAASVTSDAAATACADEGECASASPLGEGLGLGERIPLREARARSEAPILLPRSSRLGKPDEAYARRHALGFTFLYRARAVDRPWSGLPYLGDTRIGLLLTQTPGDVGAAYLPGGTVEVAGLETVSVNGEEGYWIPASGDAPEVARSAGLLAGVLLWERDGQALRLEADVSKERAVRIAESVR